MDTEGEAEGSKHWEKQCVVSETTASAGLLKICGSSELEPTWNLFPFPAHPTSAGCRKNNHADSAQPETEAHPLFCTLNNRTKLPHRRLARDEIREGIRPPNAREKLAAVQGVALMPPDAWKSGDRRKVWFISHSLVKRL